VWIFCYSLFMRVILLLLLVMILLLIFISHGDEIVAISHEVDIAAICWPWDWFCCYLLVIIVSLCCYLLFAGHGGESFAIGWSSEGDSNALSDTTVNWSWGWRWRGVRLYSRVLLLGKGSALVICWSCRRCCNLCCYSIKYTDHCTVLLK